MPKISQKKKDKISEQILHHLFEISPESQFTSKISEQIARDEEFVKTILNELQKKSLVVLIDKNPKGIKYEKRQRWRLSQQAYDIYKKHQSRTKQISSTNSIEEDSF
jgi:predicted transcriptional regulator with HTH domain